MVTLNSSFESPGGLCGLNAASSAKVGALPATRTTPHGELNITGSFNGLLNRLAKVDYWDAWVAGMRITKKAKKMGVEATIWMSEVSELTGLTSEDMRFFSSSLHIVRIVESSENPLLSAPDVFCLLKVLERFVDQGIISQSR